MIKQKQMKKTIFLLVALTTLSVSFVQAQTGDNGPTLDQTIAWLNYYGFSGNTDHGGNGVLDKIGDVRISIDNNTVRFIDNSYEKSIWSQKENSQIYSSLDQAPWKYQRTNNFTLQQVSSIAVIPPADYNGDVIVDYEVIIVTSVTVSRIIRIAFTDKKRAVSLYKALKHLNSFYNYDIKFINKLSLKNAF
ncbi:MAG: hypothetical protein JXR71_06825 [Bacteroidales bacterium]|nr:hypothetical protein [Bacteroidales bacterium]